MNQFVSILVPVYGVEKYIERCARSLFEQTYLNIEYVFVDDCTPDRSIEVLQRVMEDYPGRKPFVRIIHHDRNRGLAAARNTGVAAALGEFIIWVDSDDWIDLTLVQKAIAKQKVNDADIVCYDIEVIFPNRRMYYNNKDYNDGKQLVLQMLKGEAPHQLCGHLIRRNLYVLNNIKVAEGCNQSEDLQVMPRLSFYANTIGTVHEPLYYYDRTNENSYSSNYSIQSQEQVNSTLQVLHSFFQNKGSEYINALTIGEIRAIAQSLRHLSLIKNDKGCYSCLIKRLNMIDKQYYCNVIWYNRIVIIIKNKFLVSLYSRLLNLMKYFH